MNFQLTPLNKRKLTLLWLVLPVHKVDDISILHHVNLLLDQFRHVDHSAIGATGPKISQNQNMCLQVCS